MKKLYRVRCQVNMSAENVIEVIVETNLMKRAINIARNQLRDDGYSYVYPLSCSEIQQ